MAANILSQRRVQGHVIFIGIVLFNPSHVSLWPGDFKDSQVLSSMPMNLLLWSRRHYEVTRGGAVSPVIEGRPDLSPFGQ